MSDLFARRSPPPKPRPAPPAQSDDRRHVCAICGADAAFGFGVFLRQGRAGTWACLAHRDEVEEIAG